MVAEGAKYIGEGIAKSKSLQSINLRRNYIGAAGAEFIGEAIAKSKRLQSIYLMYDNIGDEAAYIGEGIAKSSSCAEH